MKKYTKKCELKKWNKKAQVGSEMILWAFRYIFLIFVALGVLIIVSSLMIGNFDIRKIEALALERKIADCLSVNGYLNQEIIQNKEDFLKNCGISLNDEFYVNVTISDFNNKNIFDFNYGENVEPLCKVSSNIKYRPKCLVGKYYAVNKNVSSEQITVQAPKVTAPAKGDIDLVFVLDASGSIDELKIVAIKIFSKMFIEEAKENKKIKNLGIVSFNSLYPARILLDIEDFESNYALAIKTIEEFEADGNTCIGCGLQEGVDRFSEFPPTGNRKAIFLLSDLGNNEEGISIPNALSSLSSNGIELYTVHLPTVCNPKYEEFAYIAAPGMPNPYILAGAEFIPPASIGYLQLKCDAQGISPNSQEKLEEYYKQYFEGTATGIIDSISEKKQTGDYSSIQTKKLQDNLVINILVAIKKFDKNLK
jgi:hypothetical protein